MAGYFAAIVRAPVTGTILLLEMTGSFDCLLPLIVVSFAAYLMADLLRSKPIYDSLLENLLNSGACGEGCDPARKIVLDQMVHFDSRAAGAQVKALGLPGECLLIAVRREGEEIIPSGDTVLLGGDHLTFLVTERREGPIREALEEILVEPDVR